MFPPDYELLRTIIWLFGIEVICSFVLLFMKGSTCTFTESILRNCGFNTGLFTSPHLIDVRERFRLNG